MSLIPKEEYISKVNEYLLTHSTRYTNQEIEILKANAALGQNTPFVHELLRQIYEETGLVTPGNSMYDEFVNILKTNFSIERPMLEIAGGVIPSLGKKIAINQHQGSITVYDPRLTGYSTDIPNLILKNENFTENTDIGQAKMIIGFMPCDATNMIIETACKHNVDFMVALCEGGMRKGYEFLEYDDEWISHVKSNAKRHMRETSLGDLCESSLEKFDNPYPIIYNKRKNLNEN